MKGTALALCLLFVLLAPIMSLSQSTIVLADTAKPSVPDFSVRFVNASYGVTSTNPYTGLSETTLTSNNSVEVAIKSQPFDYSNYQIYYNVRVKPHFADNWTEIYPIQNMTSSYDGDGTFSYALYINRDSPTQSSSSYTNITFPVVPTELYQASGYDIQRYYSGTEGQEGTHWAFLRAIPDGGQVDFQVQALVGHASQMWVIQHPLFPTYGGYSALAVAYDGASSWSNTQTVTIDSNPSSVPSSASPDSQNPTASSDQSGLNWTEIILFVVVGIVVVLLVVVIAFMRRRIQVLKHKSGSNVGIRSKENAEWR